MRKLKGTQRPWLFACVATSGYICGPSCDRKLLAMSKLTSGAEAFANDKMISTQEDFDAEKTLKREILTFLGGPDGDIEIEDVTPSSEAELVRRSLFTDDGGDISALVSLAVHCLRKNGEVFLHNREGIATLKIQKKKIQDTAVVVSFYPDLDFFYELNNAEKVVEEILNLGDVGRYDSDSFYAELYDKMDSAQSTLRKKWIKEIYNRAPAFQASTLGYPSWNTIFGLDFVNGKTFGDAFREAIVQEDVEMKMDDAEEVVKLFLVNTRAYQRNFFVIHRDFVVPNYKQFRLRRWEDVVKLFSALMRSYPGQGLWKELHDTASEYSREEVFQRMGPFFFLKALNGKIELDVESDYMKGSPVVKARGRRIGDIMINSKGVVYREADSDIARREIMEAKISYKTLDGTQSEDRDEEKIKERIAVLSTMNPSEGEFMAARNSAHEARQASLRNIMSDEALLESQRNLDVSVTQLRLLGESPQKDMQGKRWQDLQERTLVNLDNAVQARTEYVARESMKEAISAGNAAEQEGKVLRAQQQAEIDALKSFDESLQLRILDETIEDTRDMIDIEYSVPDDGEIKEKINNYLLSRHITELVLNQRRGLNIKAQMDRRKYYMKALTEDNAAYDIFKNFSHISPIFKGGMPTRKAKKLFGIKITDETEKEKYWFAVHLELTGNTGNVVTASRLQEICEGFLTNDSSDVALAGGQLAVYLPQLPVNFFQYPLYDGKDVEDFVFAKLYKTPTKEIKTKGGTVSNEKSWYSLTSWFSEDNSWPNLLKDEFSKDYGTPFRRRILYYVWHMRMMFGVLLNLKQKVEKFHYHNDRMYTQAREAEDLSHQILDHFLNIYQPSGILRRIENSIFCREEQDGLWNKCEYAGARPWELIGDKLDNKFELYNVLDKGTLLSPTVEVLSAQNIFNDAVDSIVGALRNGEIPLSVEYVLPNLKYTKMSEVTEEEIRQELFLLSNSDVSRQYNDDEKFFRYCQAFMWLYKNIMLLNYCDVREIDKDVSETIRQDILKNINSMSLGDKRNRYNNAIEAAIDEDVKKIMWFFLMSVLTVTVEKIYGFLQVFDVSKNESMKILVQGNLESNNYNELEQEMLEKLKDLKKNVNMGDRESFIGNRIGEYGYIF